MQSGYVYIYICSHECIYVVYIYELNFMLYSSCGYDGIYIGSESWMNLVEVGNIGVSRVDMEIEMEMN